MVKEVTKSPKSKQKITSKSSKNGEKTKNTLNPLKASSLESSKKKFGENKEKLGTKFGRYRNFSEKNDVLDKRVNAKYEKNATAKPSKISSFELAKKKFGDKKKNFEENTLNSSKVSFLKSDKKFFGDKKKAESKKKNGEYDSTAAAMEAKPKKKKRVIKIDPYDFSNKRLDDGNVLNEKTNQKEKKEEEEEEPGKISANAQFRAINPSPSILTFVEDNFLGRRRDIELRRAGYDTELPAPLDNIPFSTSSERARIEESVFRNKLEFFAAAKVSSSLPLPGVPEIAFAGK